MFNLLLIYRFRVRPTANYAKQELVVLICFDAGNMILLQL
jgi:hypothetical protein